MLQSIQKHMEDAKGQCRTGQDVQGVGAAPLHVVPSLPQLCPKRQRVRSALSLNQQHETNVGSLQVEGTFGAPLLEPVFGESMSAFFQRLRTQLGVSPSHAVGPPLTLFPGVGITETLTLTPTTRMGHDGVYLHKRPIRGPNGSSPLAVCGSVMHHVVVYVRQGPIIHALDYAPANGADVTANLFEPAPCKQQLCISKPAGDMEAEAQALAAAAGGTAEALPYMYLGTAARSVDDPVVQQALAFAATRPYHALTNNCIHFADLAVRVLTNGAVRGAPLLYDMACGAVPSFDNPMLLMMQMMLRLSWHVVVDGAPLASAFAQHYKQQQQHPQQQEQVQQGDDLEEEEQQQEQERQEAERSGITNLEEGSREGTTDSVPEAAAAAEGAAGVANEPGAACGQEQQGVVEPEVVANAAAAHAGEAGAEGQQEAADLGAEASTAGDKQAGVVAQEAAAVQAEAVVGAGEAERAGSEAVEAPRDSGLAAVAAAVSGGVGVREGSCEAGDNGEAGERLWEARAGREGSSTAVLLPSRSSSGPQPPVLAPVLPDEGAAAARRVTAGAGDVAAEDDGGGVQEAAAKGGDVVCGGGEGQGAEGGEESGEGQQQQQQQLERQQGTEGVQGGGAAVAAFANEGERGVAQGEAAACGSGSEEWGQGCPEQCEAAEGEQDQEREEGAEADMRHEEEGRGAGQGGQGGGGGGGGRRGSKKFRRVGGVRGGVRGGLRVQA